MILQKQNLNSNKLISVNTRYSTIYPIKKTTLTSIVYFHQFDNTHAANTHS